MIIKNLNYLILSLILLTNSLYAQVEFTNTEKEYISSKTITIGMVSDYYPFSFKDNDKIDGYSYEFINLVIEKSGLKVKIEMDNWSNTLKKFKTKQIDIIDAISYKKSRETFTNFSQPYYEIPNVIFSRKGEFNNYTGFESLKGKRVGVTKDIYYYDTLKDLQLFELVEFKSSKNKMKALAYEKVDAIFNNLISGQKYIKRGGYSNIEVLDEIDRSVVKREDLRLGITKEDKTLFSIINKSIYSITIQEKNSLVDKWFGVKLKSKIKNNNLTKDERIYLKEKKQITMCIDPNWMPFEKFDKNGEHIGMSAEYFQLFNKDIDIPIKVIKTKSWKESLKFAKERKCDILSLAMATPDRKKYMNFTSPYLSVPLVIATRPDITYVDNISSLSDQKIGIVKGYAFSEIIRKKYPNMKIIDVENIDDGLQKVVNGELFGFIGTLSSIGYKFQTKFIGELKITGKFDEKWELGVGVRNDDAILLNIFEKIINNLSQVEKQKILNSHISIKYEKGIDYTLIWQILSVVFIIGLFAIYRQYILNKANDDLSIQVDEKTKELKELNKNLENKVTLRTNELSENFEFIQSLLDSVIFGVVQSDMSGKCIDVNESTLNIMLYKNKSDLVGLNIFDVISDSSKELVRKNIMNNYTEPYEMKLINSKGEDFSILMKGKTIMRNGQNIRLSTFVDISNVKKQEKIIADQSKLASMGEMIGNIAHQWRQPLSVISTASTGMKLQKEYGLLTNDVFNESCNAIDNNAQYLSKTIDDFKNFIKGDTKAVNFDLKNDTDSFLKLVDSTIKNEHINIVLDLEEDINVNGYPNELIQCFINIFNNAKDALVHNKEENDRYIFISQEITNDNIAIKFKDNAGGISKEIINKIFEPYFTTKHQSQGTGLGLHMTYNLIVDGMGGTIEADNVTFEYDGIIYDGAEFTISLPMS